MIHLSLNTSTVAKNLVITPYKQTFIHNVYFSAFNKIAVEFAEKRKSKRKPTNQTQHAVFKHGENHLTKWIFQDMAWRVSELFNRSLLSSLHVADTLLVIWDIAVNKTKPVRRNLNPVGVVSGSGENMSCFLAFIMTDVSGVKRML